jgi:hypothetical protein
MYIQTVDGRHGAGVERRETMAATMTETHRAADFEFYAAREALAAAELAMHRLPGARRDPGYAAADRAVDEAAARLARAEAAVRAAYAGLSEAEAAAISSATAAAFEAGRYEIG